MTTQTTTAFPNCFIVVSSNAAEGAPHGPLGRITGPYKMSRWSRSGQVRRVAGPNPELMPVSRLHPMKTASRNQLPGAKNIGLVRPDCSHRLRVHCFHLFAREGAARIALKRIAFSPVLTTLSGIHPSRNIGEGEAITAVKSIGPQTRSTYGVALRVRRRIRFRAV